MDTNLTGPLLYLLIAWGIVTAVFIVLFIWRSVLSSHEDETTVSRAYSGKTMRVVRNEYTDYYDSHPEQLRPFPEQLSVAYSGGAMHLGGDSFSEGVDVDKECYPAGQGVGGISELVPAGELVRRFVAEAEVVLDRMATLR